MHKVLRQGDTQQAQAAFGAVLSRRQVIKWHPPGCKYCFAQLFFSSCSCDHRCRSRKKKLLLQPSTKDTKLRSDALVTTTEGYFLRIIEETDEGVLKCRPLQTTPFTTTGLGINVPWSMIGVCNYLGHDKDEIVEVTPGQVRGKALLCGDVLSEWLPEWLTESKVTM